MSKSRKVISTTIKVHPAVFRYLDVTFNKIGDTYDFRGHILYGFISAGLSRKGMNLPSMLPLQYKKMQAVKIAISSWDYQHYGWDIPIFQQVAFSNHLYRQILFNACYRIMICHVFGGLPRDKAIRNFLTEHCFEESELNYAALRKHYQRHWLENEKLAKKNVANFSTISSDFSHKINTKKNVGIVPFFFHQKIID
jgi:hypothetical protein